MVTRTHHQQQRGFAYVWTLLLVAFFAASSLLAVRMESSLTTRSREADLIWIGLQFRKALREYYMDNQDKPDRYPRTLEELTDPRGQLVPKRYLRRIYIDPMTGNTDWGVVRSPGGGILGVYSKAAGEPRKKHGLPKELESFEKATSYREWLFAFDPAGLSGKATP
jgi:hypothetical protein